MSGTAPGHEPSSAWEDVAPTSDVSLSLSARTASARVLTELAARLAGEMVQRWRAGERPCAEEYLGQYPELAAHREAAVDLIYEEVCLRQEHGESVDVEALLARFPAWRAPLQVLLDCHRLLESRRSAARLPEAGETLGEFRLLAELGRGAQGRVFLASQADLAGRHVVLKLTPCTGQEHLALARLQHTHVVPLLSASEDAERDLRILCMPYFGGATLARVLELLRDRPPAARTGRDLLRALDEAQRTAPVALPTRGPGRERLAAAGYVEAVCVLGVCLAEALQHAHERGLLHLDLKPANVLLAADATPLLLDFHLAREPIRPGQPVPGWLGGTLAYMPREQQAALAAVSEGRQVTAAVDARADVYALGVVLYEALGGPHPHLPGVSPRLERCNSAVSVGLADAIHRCLAFEAGDRYAEAGAVAADLRRHLTDRPLQGVRNRSLGERWRKWRRRRPHALALGAMALAVGLALAALAAGGTVWILQRQELSAELERASHARDDQERERLAQQLHRLADQLRGRAGAPAPAGPALRSLEAACRDLWERRGLVCERLGSARARDDLLDLALCWCDLHVGLSPADRLPAARREALAVLAEAEASFGPSPVLAHERRQHGDAGVPAGPAARTAWEHTALGRSWLRDGDWDRAAEHLDAALRLEPVGLWPNFYRGLCWQHAGRYQEAVTAFSVCVGAAPDSAAGFYNRGLACAALGRADEAGRDYDRALQLDPTFAAAALNRGILHYRAGRLADAVLDLERALDVGADPAAAHYNLALVRLARGERDAARRHLQVALDSDPGNPDARALRERLRREP
jgi:serine/threonine protein kinase/Tfp pilus assembly protein PilF